MGFPPRPRGRFSSIGYLFIRLSRLSFQSVPPRDTRSKTARPGIRFTKKIRLRRVIIENVPIPLFPGNDYCRVCDLRQGQPVTKSLKSHQVVTIRTVKKRITTTTPTTSKRTAGSQAGRLSSFARSPSLRSRAFLCPRPRRCGTTVSRYDDNSARIPGSSCRKVAMG